MGVGVFRLGEGGGLLPSATFCVWAPSSTQKEPEVQVWREGWVCLPWGWLAASSHPFPKGKGPESPDLLGISLVAFDINVGTRPPECKWLISGDLEASRQSLRPTGNDLISGGKRRREGFREKGPRNWKCWS